MTTNKFPGTCFHCLKLLGHHSIHGRKYASHRAAVAHRHLADR